MLIIAHPTAKAPTLAAMYARLPARGKETDFLVVEMTDSYLLDRCDCVGIYFEDGLSLIEADDEEGLTFLHEFAHHVWVKSLTPAEQQRWARTWRGLLRFVPETGGGRSCAAEGWAECYSYYFRSPDMRRKLNAGLQKAVAAFFESKRPAR